MNVDINPFFVCYANDAHLRAEQYAGTTAIFVLGRANCVHDEWQRVKDRGSEILKYEIHIERPDSRVSAIDEEVYGGNSATVPLWPYLDANRQQRCHKPNGIPNGTKFTDIRVGSPLVARYADHVAAVIRSGRYSGLFLDGDGGQLWGAADWNNWPAGERQEWTAGMVDKARRLDEVRRAENPNFLLIGNNHWDIVPAAEKYVDGVVSENHPITNLAMQRIVGKPYSNLGHRRVFAISRTNVDALAWSQVPGVTHVCSTAANTAAGDSKYAYPTAPVVPYRDIRTGELRAKVAQLEYRAAALEADAANTSAVLNAANAEIARLRETEEKQRTMMQAAAAELGYGAPA